MSMATINPVPVGGDFDGDKPDPSKSWGWLGDHSDRFDKGVEKLKGELDAAFAKLAGDKDGNGGDPTNPAYLADYQTALSGYTTYRTLQSNSAKSLSDMQKQNARNLG
ncbi:EscF/YscF/HrpA family type III secretion system needle major subunit [Stenotrophomonas sp.]|uniref:EscF/YscF/HrpA family type III secretion system needle major subunit n=1 Tax=Stenotrophomonas sp. TaxID=69392 RepID=UPI0028968CD9|nr:EscF/YscF/HrpA family type III secretion system needle major subunit [Stenotrophomonas sp.]